ncbi:MAG: glycoside hydrolase family protein [Paludibacteraceae bacterium]|nr:glycoside hydrolase family protein [Paludibacteraceae bacterium]
MKTTQKTINKIAEFEGFRADAYEDPAGIPTIGYGHTLGVKMGDFVTHLQAIELLKQDIEKFENMVMSYNYRYHWTQNEFDALVCFAFNIGNIDTLTAYGTRTKAEIANTILKYVYCGDEVLEGLIRRREWEHVMFVGSDLYSGDTGEVEEFDPDIIDITDIAREVIAGDWGNGEQRFRMLGEWFTDKVQNRVNELMEKGE